MEIRDARIVILGGSGLVGMAIARELIPLRPRALVISALTEREAREGVQELLPAAGTVEVVPEWGNLFAPLAIKDRARDDVLDDPEVRGALLEDLYGSLSQEALERSTLGDLVLRHRPHAVVDCVNTATGFAYQNVFKSVSTLRQAARRGAADVEAVEKHLTTIELPHLIHHVWVAMSAMRQAGTLAYLKVGTAGSGGMGLNVPFTHSEDRPSRQLLSKSAIAGAHTLLLYLMARTPGAPAVKEIKPTAAISWKSIRSGPVVWRGAPIARVDAVAPVEVADAFPADASREERREWGRDTVWRESGGVLSGVHLDSGENGLFSPDEFEVLTALGLMEFITPEEIARDAVWELTGRPTGHDVVAALDAATSGPTYRAGVLRQSALDYMDGLERAAGVRSVGFEMLGPPRLTKLLYEGEILRRLCADLSAAAALDAEDASARAEALVRGDADLRTRILSANLAVLLRDGRLLRGRRVAVEPAAGEGSDEAARKGWVDLRPGNWELWRGRAAAIVARIAAEPGPEGGSRWDMEPWHRDGSIRPGALAAWVFRHEDGGERIKR